MSTKVEEKNNSKDLKKDRRRNANLYPFYKIFGWDLLSYYSIEYLFLTITKGILPSQVLIISASYVIFKVIFQIPSIIITEYFGKKKSIILANILVLLSMFFVMISPNLFFICLVQSLTAIGYAIKAICDGNLLYDSVSTKGGEGLYTKLETKGASGYYIVDAILSMVAGYLFVINNYIPMLICLLCLLISVILSFNFKEIYKEKKKKKSIKQFAKEYKTDIVASLKFIKKSKRIRAYLIFASAFYGILRIMDAYKSTLLTEMGVKPEQYSIIIAVLCMIAGLSVGFSKSIQKKFKNRTLTFLSITYLLSWLTITIIAFNISNSIAIPIILILYGVNRICDSQWYVIRGKYLKNFTEPKSREKITFTFELISCLVGGLSALLGSFILSITDIRHAILLVALLGFGIMVVILDYMRTRFGLKPKQYSKDDIKF